MKRFRLIHVWLLPAIWLGIALLSAAYTGGDLVLAIGLMPGLLISKLAKLSIGSLGFGDSSLWIQLSFGLIFMAGVGLLLDWNRVRRKVWFVTAGVGTFLTLLLLTWFIWREASRSGWPRAISLFNLDDHSRSPAWVVFCLLGGVYLGTLLALLITWGMNAFNWWQTRKTPHPAA